MQTFGITVQTVSGGQSQTWVTTELTETQLADRIREAFDVR